MKFHAHDLGQAELPSEHTLARVLLRLLNLSVELREHLLVAIARDLLHFNMLTGALVCVSMGLAVAMHGKFMLETVSLDASGQRDKN